MSLRPPLLSVDVDAQLRKLPARRFQRPEHYLVEWVRGALARGATRIDVQSLRGKVTVVDDGDPLDSQHVEALTIALDPNRSEAERRGGLEPFERGDGIELLAPLAPEGAKVELETGVGPSRYGWALRIGERPRSVRPTGADGTRVTVRRKGDPGAERAALKEYVRFAPATINLDGEPLPAGPPEDALAYGRCVIDGRQAHVWIPASGDTCRLWSTRFGVRERQRLLPAVEGLIFHAALEEANQVSNDWLPVLRKEAASLYHLVATRYASLTGPGRERADELLFHLHRKGGEDALIQAFKVFVRLDSETLCPLQELVSLSGQGPLLALRMEESRSGFDLGDSPVFRLSAAQWEFLTERAQVSLVRPPARVRRRWRGRMSLRKLWWAWRIGRAQRRAATRPEVEPDPSLKVVAQAVLRYAPVPAPVVWLAGRSPLPAVLARRAGGQTLCLFIDAPDVRAAAADLADHPKRDRLWAAHLLRGDT